MYAKRQAEIGFRRRAGVGGAPEQSSVLIRLTSSRRNVSALRNGAFSST
jgi:hypothetical protein